MLVAISLAIQTSNGYRALNGIIASPELGTRKRAWWSKVLSLNWPYYFPLARHPPGLAAGLRPLLRRLSLFSRRNFFLSREKRLRVEPEAGRSFVMLDHAHWPPPMPPRRHKLGAAAPSERRVRLVKNFAQISTVGKTRLWLKAVSFSRTVVIAQ